MPEEEFSIVILKRLDVPKVMLLFIAICFSKIGIAQKATDNFSGKWKTAEGSIIVITKSNGAFIGKPIGKEYKILEDLQFINGRWLGYFPKQKHKCIKVACEANLQGNKIKFFTKVGYYYKEFYWTKMN